MVDVVLRMAFANDICDAGVEKKKPALGGLGGLLTDIFAALAICSCADFYNRSTSKTSFATEPQEIKA